MRVEYEMNDGRIYWLHDPIIYQMHTENGGKITDSEESLEPKEYEKRSSAIIAEWQTEEDARNLERIEKELVLAAWREVPLVSAPVETVKKKGKKK